MTETKKTTGKHFKKEAGLKVAAALASALGDLKESLGEKKFFRNIKKASKAMIAGLTDKTTAAPAKAKNAAPKKSAAKKAIAKKAVAKKAAPKKAATKKATAKTAAKTQNAAIK
ncbi:hypothetical protein CLV51_10417 [Chitinophaga niastensis]|uniref:Histone H1-like nucleoprotein HC2 n=1 Tax=Chitinophaga niastensis TaxID=536980 RepID=A0A2P8HGH8_CHINA|nr:histone [Chitinophaga niastensis]PSL45315.1 hypothetical protein CLV51_10417 [Chitinophaga niastensis]